MLPFTYTFVQGRWCILCATPAEAREYIRLANLPESLYTLQIAMISTDNPLYIDKDGVAIFDACTSHPNFTSFSNDFPDETGNVEIVSYGDKRHYLYYNGHEIHDGDIKYYTTRKQAKTMALHLFPWTS